MPAGQELEDAQTPTFPEGRDSMMQINEATLIFI